MTRSLAILGASGHGKVLADTAMASGWRKIEFYDDAWPDKQANERWQIVGLLQLTPLPISPGANPMSSRACRVWPAADRLQWYLPSPR